MIKLRYYQREAIDAVEKGVLRGVRRPLIALPTGTGKTVVFSELVRGRGGSGLILAHRDELIQQARDKFVSMAPELALSVGIVKAKQNDVTSPIVVASVQTLARESRLSQLPRNYHTAVCDEAHHAAADSYKRVFEHLSESDLIVGVTATPERTDSRKLGDVWEEVVYARSIEEMIREGYLCDLQGVRVHLDVDLSQVRQSRGDFSAGDLGRAMEEADAPAAVADAYLEHAPKRKGIVFTPTVHLAELTAFELRQRGLTAEAVSAKTETTERRAILRRLDSGETQVVCNVGVLTEGFDCPSLEAIVVATPTRSRVKYVQMVGRGTRIFPDKTDCLILDCVGVSERLSVQSLPEIFGLEKPPAPGENVTQAQEREARENADAAERTAQADAARKKARAAQFSPFSREAIHWQQVEGRWITAGGGKDELLVLYDSPLDGSYGYAVMLIGKSNARVLAKNLDLGYAQGVAEEVIRDQKATALADTRAKWRSEKSSSGQRAYLQRLGVPAAGLTKGEAADAITDAVARERLERLDLAMERRAQAAADNDSVQRTNGNTERSTHGTHV